MGDEDLTMDLESSFYLQNIAAVNDNDSGNITSHKFLKQAICGGLSGLMTRFLTQPLDVLKIRFQLQVEPMNDHLLDESDYEYRQRYKNFGSDGFTGSQQDAMEPSSSASQKSAANKAKYLSMNQAGRTIYQEEGIQGFWKGHTSGQMATISFMLVQFWCYERMMDKLEELNLFSNQPSLSRFICGGGAGCMGTIVSMPFDVCRTREIGQDPKEGRNMYRTLKTVATEEGFRGLFRGLNSSMSQIVPLIGLNYVLYYKFNSVLKQYLHEPTDDLTHLELLLTGGMAGAGSKFILYPMDLIKRRIQLQGFHQKRKSYGRNHTCTSMRSCAMITYREEGLIGFYKGVIPTILKSGLSTALYFAFYELFTSLLQVEGTERKAR